MVKAHGGVVVLVQYPQVYSSILNDDDDFNSNVRENFKSELAQNAMTPSEFLSYVSAFRKELYSDIETRGIKLITFLSPFRVADFYDSIHFNVSGSTSFAELLYEKIENIGCNDNGVSD